ncbi:MAG: flagellar motor switch phosphatase FliY [Peptococcaceae bacterium]|nr:flagellar motor switch phosphatase FliY [Peptococcaceae bacterium]MDH7524047.1 flagellar motor switch phosphatase FliY [Peptococcaceae bacterium]
MSSGSILSQDEINALLNDTFAKNAGTGETPEESNILDPMEVDTLGEIANISMGAAATTLSSLLGKKIEITTPSVSLTTTGIIKKEYDKAYVMVDVNYNRGLQGSNILVIHSYDAGVMVDLMMGGDGSQPPLELNELHLSAVSEAMNQMMGTSCTSLSQILNKRIDISPPTLDLYEMKNYHFAFDDTETIVKISFKVVIQGLIDSEMMQLMPVSFAKELYKELMAKNDFSDKAVNKGIENEFTGKTAKPAERRAEPMPYQQSQFMEVREFQTEKLQSPVTVSPPAFQQFSPEPAQVSGQPNLNLILDVGLQLSVELGRTQRKIKDILELTTGSIIELDKLAGEPADILVNGKLLAKGEVVVIDENFGVRVTEIISPAERVKNLR